MQKPAFDLLHPLIVFNRTVLSDKIYGRRSGLIVE